jgi:hypothetical protein
MNEAAALPSPAVLLSARVDRYYGRLRRPPGPPPLPGSTPVIGRGAPTAPSPQTAGPGRASPVPAATLRAFRAPYAGEFFGAAIQALRPFRGLRRERRGSALPSSRPQAGTLTARQASLDATDRSVAPPNGALDAGLRPGPFPDRAASLLPGLLAATRTGLTPAGGDELVLDQVISIDHLQLWAHSLSCCKWRRCRQGHGVGSLKSGKDD